MRRTYNTKQITKTKTLRDRPVDNVFIPCINQKLNFTEISTKLNNNIAVVSSQEICCNYFPWEFAITNFRSHFPKQLDVVSSLVICCSFFSWDFVTDIYHNTLSWLFTVAIFLETLPCLHIFWRRIICFSLCVRVCIYRNLST